MMIVVTAFISEADVARRRRPAQGSFPVGKLGRIPPAGGHQLPGAIRDPLIPAGRHPPVSGFGLWEWEIKLGKGTAAGKMEPLRMSGYTHGQAAGSSKKHHGSTRARPYIHTMLLFMSVACIYTWLNNAYNAISTV